MWTFTRVGVLHHLDPPPPLYSATISNVPLDNLNRSFSRFCGVLFACKKVTELRSVFRTSPKLYATMDDHSMPPLNSHIYAILCD